MFRKKSDKKSGGNKSSSKRSTITPSDLTSQIQLSTADDSLDSSSTTATSSRILSFSNEMFEFLNWFVEENKRSRKRQRTDSVEKLKAFENKVVIEIKLPDEIKTCLSHDWQLINKDNKVEIS